MENMNFDSTDIGTLIPPKINEGLEPENKPDLQQMNMMEFSSSIDDLMPQSAPDTSVYTNPTSGRTTGIALPDTPKPVKKDKNPLNLTDDQYQAIIAGVIGIIVYSNSVQIKLSALVPNFTGMNGSIASAILIAVLFYFAKNYLIKK